MAGYTVKQIADMLDTNQETVRRWIREGRLTSVRTSRKDGHVVSEEEFQRFINTTPKYASRLATAIAPFSAGAGLAVFLGSLAGSAALDYMVKKKTTIPRILPEDAKAFLENNIKDLEDQIEQKTLVVQQIEKEIQDIRSKIAAYRYLIDQGIAANGDTLDNDEGD